MTSLLSLVTRSVQSAEGIAEIVLCIPPNGTKCHELGGKVNELLVLLRRMATIPPEMLDKHCTVLAFENLKVTLRLIEKFFRYAVDSIADGFEDGLDPRVLALVNKLDRDAAEINEKERRGCILSPVAQDRVEAVEDGRIFTANGPACIAAAIRKEVQQLKAAAANAKHAAESLRQLVRNHDTVAVVEKAGDPAWWVELLSDENEVVSNVAARAVRRLASDDANGLPLIKAGAVPHLIRLISGGCDDSKAVADAALDKLANHGAAAVNAARSILNRVQLLKDGAECSKQREACALRELAAIQGNRKTIAAAGAIPPLVQLLSVGNDIMKVQAALVLTQLAGNTDNKKNIAAKAVPQLVRLLSYRSEAVRVAATSTLRNLALNDVDNTIAIATAGAIPLLVQLLVEGAEDGKVLAAGVLCDIAGDVAENKRTITAAVPPLIQLLMEGSEKAKQTTAAALHNLAVDDMDSSAAIAAAGVVPVLVQMLQTGTRCAKANAAALLWCLTVYAENQNSIIAEEAIPTLLQVLGADLAIPMRFAGSALEVLASRPNNRKALVTAGAIPVLVQVLQRLRRCTDVVDDSVVGTLFELVCNNGPGGAAFRVENPGAALRRVHRNSTPDVAGKAKKLLEQLWE
jgi:vacuolar protein 8